MKKLVVVYSTSMDRQAIYIDGELQEEGANLRSARMHYLLKPDIQLSEDAYKVDSKWLEGRVVFPNTFNELPPDKLTKI